MKKLIRLTEQELHNIIRESVNRILSENSNLLRLYHTYNDFDESTSNGIWLSDEADFDYGKHSKEFILDTSNVKIADEKTVIKYILMNDIHSFEDACDCEYGGETDIIYILIKSVRNGEMTNEEAYSYLLKNAFHDAYPFFCEIMEHPHYFNFLEQLKNDGYDGYKFLYLGNYANYYFIFKGKHPNLKVLNIHESKWNGNGEEWQDLTKPTNMPSYLYHVAPKSERNSILKNGLLATVGEEYSDWWNYEEPNGEEPDEEELPNCVFLTDNVNSWMDNLDYGEDCDIWVINTKMIDINQLYLDNDKSMRNKGSYCYLEDIPPTALKLLNAKKR